MASQSQPEGHDMLSLLSSEVLSNIISYLLPVHDPEDIGTSYTSRRRTHKSKCSATKSRCPATDPDCLVHDSKCPAASLPLLCFSQSSRRMEVETQRWAEHFLRQHAALTKYKVRMNARSQGKRKFLTELPLWLRKHCVFCGERCKRKAAFMNGLYCCYRCDEAQWPDKIPGHEALEVYDLSDDHLRPRHSSVSPEAMPRARRSTEFSFPMFLRTEIEQIAAFVHGDNWKVHLSERLRDSPFLQEQERARQDDAKYRVPGTSATVLETYKWELIHLEKQNNARLLWARSELQKLNKGIHPSPSQSNDV